jgi:sugar/nucleoside kinase (ribokinase family)
MATEVGDDFLEPISLIGSFPSGAPAIFIDQVAKLGQPCGLIGCVGDDDFGRLNIKRLRRDGADVSAIAFGPDHPTGSAFVRYRADGSRDFLYNIRHSASAAIALSALSPLPWRRWSEMGCVASVPVAERCRSIPTCARRSSRRRGCAKPR